MNQDNQGNVASLRDLPAILLTFLLVLLPWIFFRSANIEQAVYIIKKIFNSFPFGDVEMLYPKRLMLIVGLVLVEWVQRRKEHPLCLDSYPRWVRYSVYYVLVVIIVLFGTYNYTPFIYFQF